MHRQGTATSRAHRFCSAHTHARTHVRTHVHVALGCCNEQEGGETETGRKRGKGNARYRVNDECGQRGCRASRAHTQPYVCQTRIRMASLPPWYLHGTFEPHEGARRAENWNSYRIRPWRKYTELERRNFSKMWVSTYMYVCVCINIYFYYFIISSISNSTLRVTSNLGKIWVTNKCFLIQSFFSFLGGGGLTC